MAGNAEEEDDYLSMTFEEPKAKESTFQRTARLKKEAAERGRPLSKAELAEKAKHDRDIGLATELDSSNKGAKMMAKMGFKGGALGRSEDARTRPVELQIKDDRGGIGMDSEKKRKIREAAAEAEEGDKRQKVGLDEFRERNRVEREEKRTEGLTWGAMNVLEKFESEAEAEDEGKDDVGNDDGKVEKATKKPSAQHLHEVNVLYRPLIKQRLERERERKMRNEVNNSLSNRDDFDSDEDKAGDFDQRVDELDDEDSELEGFEALSFAERLEKIVKELRSKYLYCFWCKFQYPSEDMEGCPGLTEDEHG